MWPKNKGLRNDQREDYGSLGFGPSPFVGNAFEEVEARQEPEPAPEAETVSPQVAASAQAIGGRYETMNSALDGIGRLIEQLRQIEPLMAEVRGPLIEEFETRRSEHAELSALRYAHEQTEAALIAAHQQEREALNKLATAEITLSELEAARISQTATLEDRESELERLRGELLQYQMKSQHLDASLRDMTARNGEMEQDIGTLRMQLDDVDRRRSDAESHLARATQDITLIAEEAAVVKKRYEQAAAEVSRLSRVETDLDSQLTAERNRLLAAESAALTMQAESTRMIRSLETQLDLARSELSSIQTRVETATVRASKLEELNGQLGARLAESGNKQQNAERLAAETRTLLERAADRIRVLEEEVDGFRSRYSGVEIARAAAVERAEQLAKSLSGHERAVERAEGRATQIRQKLERIMTGHEASLHEKDQKIEALQKEVERSRAEAALAEGALETVRRDRDRLQVAVFGSSAAA